MSANCRGFLLWTFWLVKFFQKFYLALNPKHCFYKFAEQNKAQKKKKSQDKIREAMYLDWQPGHTRPLPPTLVTTPLKCCFSMDVAPSLSEAEWLGLHGRAPQFRQSLASHFQMVSAFFRGGGVRSELRFFHLIICLFLEETDMDGSGIKSTEHCNKLFDWRVSEPRWRNIDTCCILSRWSCFPSLFVGCSVFTAGHLPGPWEARDGQTAGASPCHDTQVHVSMTTL